MQFFGKIKSTHDLIFLTSNFESEEWSLEKLFQMFIKLNPTGL